MIHRVNAIVKEGLKEDVLLAAGYVCQCAHREHLADGFRCKTSVTQSSNFIADAEARWHSSDNVVVICDSCFEGGHVTNLVLPS